MKKISIDKTIIIKIILAAITPVVACIIYCALDGHAINDVFFPTAYWNDELIYYKQVEAVVEYGIPQGYFGYNGSHALIGTFSTWGPVALAPWIIWGFLFGWTYFSPIMCNMVYASLCLILFVVFTKPTWKRLSMFLIFHIIYYPFSRYILSCMPEVYAYETAILVAGLIYSAIIEFRWYKIAVSSIVIFLLTLSRPYLLLLMLLVCVPVWNRRKVCTIPFVLSMPLFAGIYLGYSNAFCAKYLNNSMDLSWLETIKYNSFLASAKYMMLLLGNRMLNLLTCAGKSIIEGYPIGGFCITYLCATILLVISLFIVKKKELRYFALCGVVADIGVLMAVLLFYSNIQQAAKHFISFTAISMCIIILNLDKLSALFESIWGMLALWIFVALKVPDNVFNLDISYADEVSENELSYWNEVFNSVSDADDYYGNTIFLVLNDEVNGTDMFTDIIGLYSAPSFTAIDICTCDYINENISKFSGGYIFTCKDGNVAKTCLKNEYELLGETETTVLFKGKN